jgi:Flp pilus assembly protein TadG
MKTSLFRFKRDERGSVVVEFAFYSVILTLMLIGVIDFGLAYAREMAMSNAVRAGTQFALARHPEIGPSADTTDALISLQDIRDSVVEASSFLDSDPGSTQLDVTVFCECEDGSSTICLSTDSTPITCAVRTVMVRVQLNVPYDLTLTFPGLPSQLTLSTEHIIRIA